MAEWRITEQGYSQENETRRENRFFLGNGYMGIRGSLEEYKKNMLPAINLAGIYDRVGEGWREPLNAPNGLYTYVMVDDSRISLPEFQCSEHMVTLDFRSGIFSRSTSWKTDKGTISVHSERFASMENPHLIVMKYGIQCDFSGEITMVTGIDGDVWDIHGPHYDEIRFQSKEMNQEEELLLATGITHEKKEKVYVSEYCNVTELKRNVTKVPDVSIITEDKKILHQIKFLAESGTSYEIVKYVTVYTSKDTGNASLLAWDDIVSAGKKGYEKLRSEQIASWENLWKVSEIVIEGDEEAMTAINYSLYHLNSIAPRHTDSLSIAARGLSGQTYKGAVFWDTEMFILDFFLYTQPKVARSLIKYRIDTLPGALKKAEEYGYEGAFYAWESQEGGYDACSDYNVTDVFTNRPMRTFFKDKQVHISAAVVYAIMNYLHVTKDYSILYEKGAKVILECARFYYSLLLKRLTKEQYEIHDVIGPDEYHERVNNNGYTNRMAKYTFEQALKILDFIEQEKNLTEEYESIYDFSKLKTCFRDAMEKLYIPQPDAKTSVIEQFDGYHSLEEVSVEILKSRLIHPKEYWGGAYGVASQTKVIKQADVVTWLTLFAEEYEKETLWKNWEYYEPRTEHGSSLSACMYALLACKCDHADQAYPFFMKSATADFSGGGKEWAGNVYIGGTHPAAAGGAYMTILLGFGGIKVEKDMITAEPKLPAHWKKLMFTITLQEKKYRIEIRKNDKKNGKKEEYTISDLL